MQRDKFFKEIENVIIQMKHWSKRIALLWNAVRDEFKGKYKDK